MVDEPPNAERILRTLADHDVDYLLIGGLALRTHGHLRTTMDADIIPAPHPANLERLAEALRHMKAWPLDCQQWRRPQMFPVLRGKPCIARPRVVNVFDIVINNALESMRKAQDRITIGHVAAEAGVSIATVSRVVNGRYGVAPDTSSRVQAVIDDLGYESSLVARSLRSHRTSVIGIIVPDLEPFSTELLKGAARAIHSTGYELIVCAGDGHVGAQVGWERRYLSRLNGTLADGTLLVTPTVVEVAHTAPVVVIDPHAGASPLPTVASQNLEGAMTATDYLIGLGHRRIGFIAGRPDLESARLRQHGYVEALERSGIKFDPDLVRVGEYTREATEGPARELLEMSDPPTAIFAANDVSAIATMDVAQSLGLSVPGDLSVIGFDNILESALSAPSLTTIDQSIQEMGYEATRLLVELIDDPDQEPAHLTLPTELVVRQSCRAVTV